MTAALTERQQQFRERVERVKRRAHGNWRNILLHLGLSEAMIVKRRNMPCPLCGGTDRFQFTDAFGEGNYVCRGCGAGGGFKLLQAVTGWDFRTALEKVEQSIGYIEPPSPSTSSDVDAQNRMRKLAQRLWSEARPLATGDAVDVYLRGRGLTLSSFPSTLRCHPALGYFEKGANGKAVQVASFTAMLARVDNLAGEMVALHRTYVLDGAKAPVPEIKRILGRGIGGASIRLFPATDVLCLAEGVEDALAIHLATGRPAWAALNAGNLEKIELPAHVRAIDICGDNDADAEFDGQASAFALARRLKREEKRTGARRVRVFLPREAGTDWADVWRLRQAATPQDTPASQSVC